MASRERCGKEKGRKVRKRSCDDLLDHKLMKVLAKPQRVRILAILAERVASPKEISEETGEHLSSVSYHVKVLLDHGLIELVPLPPMPALASASIAWADTGWVSRAVSLAPSGWH